MRRTLWCGLLLACAPGAIASAQSSGYSVLGLGFPASPMGLRARALGGGIVATDARSPVNPATIVAMDRLSAVSDLVAVRRSFEADGVSVSGLSETRFPFGTVGGRIPGSRFHVAATFSGLLDRSYDIATADTLVIRGASVAVDDRFLSRGAVADVRGAAAWVASRHLSLGVGGHVLSGSSRLEIRRTFDNTAYASVREQFDESYGGFGASAGVLMVPTSRLRLGGAVRMYGTMDRTQEGGLLESHRLPYDVTGGYQLGVSPEIAWSATVSWSAWSRTADGLAGSGTRAFDSWWIGTGLEFNRAVRGFPLRMGARYATLPFSPTDEQPAEIALAAGTGFRFAGGRAQIDLTAEWANRTGGGLTERALLVGAALVIVP